MCTQTKPIFKLLKQSSRNLSVLSDMTSKIWADLLRTDTRLIFCNRKFN